MDRVLTLPPGRSMTVDDLDAIPWRGAKYELFDGCLVITPETMFFSQADLDAWPDDGWRHELIAGALVMTPSPLPRHQAVVTELWAVLSAARPDGYAVFVAPLDVRVVARPDEPDEVFQPDVLVTRSENVTESGLVNLPLLAVEVLSPSTRSFDLSLKRARYEVAGIQSYWVVDPVRCRLTAWELRDGVYVEVADTTDTFTAELPYPVTIAVADLTR